MLSAESQDKAGETEPAVGCEREFARSMAPVDVIGGETGEGLRDETSSVSDEATLDGEEATIGAGETSSVKHASKCGLEATV